MDKSDIAAAGGQEVAAEIREQFVEPFIEAVTTSLCEMACIEVVVQSAHRLASPKRLGGISAAVEIRSATDGYLVLSFPQRTAAALAARILAGAADVCDASLIRDCMGEIANVVAGQAKARLAGTRYQFSFSIPKVLAGADAFPTLQSREWLVVAFSSDQGEFAMQLSGLWGVGSGKRIS